MADDNLVDIKESQTFEAYAAQVLCGTPTADRKGMSLLLTCIDYRYSKRIVDAMQRFSPAVPYDQFILAGASLGACVPHWQDVLVEHVKVALSVGHNIERLVILDHRDCGAYRHPREIGVPQEILREGLPKDVLPSVEKGCHEAVLAKLVAVLEPRLKELVPEIKIGAWLLTRDEDDPLSY